MFIAHHPGQGLLVSLVDSFPRPAAVIMNLLLSFILSISAVSSLTIPSLYAPISAVCPSTPLVRPATGLSSSETTYVTGRKAKASVALKAWLQKTNSGFQTTALPTIALTTSGGGYRSLLTGAGVLQGFDSRDSNVGTSGVFQGLTYQAGLSGGAWLLSSFAGNNYPTVSSLKKNLWEKAFAETLILPDGVLFAVADAAISNDIKAKQAAGFPPTLTDPWGRLLSYQLLNGLDGGAATKLSSITSFSNFTSQNVPFPIITALNVKTAQGECLPSPDAITYEFSPYEFGSFDSGVSAFTPTQYLGTSLSNGVPTKPTCVQNYDNLGYVLGTSSNVFNEACVSVPQPLLSSDIIAALTAIVDKAHEVGTRDEYAIYPNPFQNYPRSSLVSTQSELSLVDGGEAGQNNPIFPFLQPTRGIDVIIVNDNSADSNNFPDGSEILQTYQQSIGAGLTKMPFIPPVSTFTAQGLNKRPTFFGCDDPAKITIVYLPNVNYTFPSNEPTSKLEYSASDTDAMIANGVQIAAKGGDPLWPTCLGCAFLKKTAGATLPAACGACFSTYCYRQ